MTPPSSRRVAYWAAVVLAVPLTAGGVVFATIGSGTASAAGPSATVLGYFAALQRGDAAAALGYGTPATGSRKLLSAAVLAEQERIAPIRSVSVEGVQRFGALAVVSVRYVLDFPSGQRVVTSRLRLRRAGSSWRLRRVAVRTRLRVASASGRATLAGAALPRRPVLLFPGAAPIRFDTPYLAVGPSGGSVVFDAPHTIVVHPVLTQVGRTAAVGAVSRALRQCLTAARPDPACPLPQHRVVPGTVHGQVLDRLANDVHVRLIGSPAGVLDIAGHASVRGRYQRLTFRDRVVSTRGRFALPVHARAYAVAPPRIRWVST